MQHQHSQELNGQREIKRIVIGYIRFKSRINAQMRRGKKRNFMTIICLKLNSSGSSNRMEKKYSSKLKSNECVVVCHESNKKPTLNKKVYFSNTFYCTVLCIFGCAFYFLLLSKFQTF
jgi:hypothetical protein